MKLPLERVDTPAYVIDLEKLRRNAQVIAGVQERTGVRILLALKGFSAFGVFGEIRDCFAGICSSGLYEARLGSEKFGKEVHCYCPAFKEEEFPEVLRYADHISFNSIAQWQKFAPQVSVASRPIQCGLRINPRYSEVAVEIYNPCAPRSRLGILPEQLEGVDLAGISGLHFHTLCEQGADVLERTLERVEAQFSSYFPNLQWINMGGGHHITRDDYDVERLCRLLEGFQNRYPHLQIYLEPGEAVALQAGVLVARVLDIVENEGAIAILDTSATAHMPDVLEMPYRPEIVGAGQAGELAHTYRLGGLTCLAGDVIGEYSFAEPLEVGQKLVFTDMAHYTMVKNTTFNGVPLPAIATYDEAADRYAVLRSFGYEDFVGRLS